MRKTVLLLIFSFTFITSAFSQITKGSLLLGGDLSAFSNKQEFGPNNKNKSSGITLSPLIGKAVKDNLFIGIYASLGYNKNETTPLTGKASSNSYGAGLFVRKYGVVKNNLYGFLQGNVGFNYAKSSNEQTGFSSENKQTSAGINISPGLSYKISKKIHLEAGLRDLAALIYGKTKTTNNNLGVITNSESKGLSLSGNLTNLTSSLFVGFRLLLSKS
jgi:Outer membrane protein beta-barrel domain